MSISSSLNAGVAGLAANSTKLSTISDNIANSGTYGYKRAETEFSSMVLSQTANSYSAGGVRASTSRIVDEQGALVSTSNALDLAVSGRGFLPVISEVALENAQSNQTLQLTTTGAFRTDEDGVLKTNTGLVLLGWPANADGTIPTYARDSVSGLQPVVINANQTAGDPTTKVNLGVNLPAVDVDDTTSLPLSVEYYGNLGTSESLNVTFTPALDTSGNVIENTWTMELRDSATEDDAATTADENLLASYTLVFDNTTTNGGTLKSVTPIGTSPAYDSTNGTVTLSAAEGLQTIDLTIGKIGDTNGLTQLSDSFSPTNVTRDGSPVGSLTTVEVDENGYVNATYDTGFTRTIYQIPLVDVPNANGLTANDNQTFEISGESGSFFLWDAGDGPTGAIEGYAREGSSVDVAKELTDLIQTQRAYSSNAKVIQTVDEMLQETTNIKR
ncbi:MULTISPECIES: flagellar hook protein FlgE [Thioclava]|uniref:Flagellar hook protein FlgE n=1 Tax=Thioclava litoralis TaxID=3076557 RepID=A0ABZ1DXJ3_9RHOB|nr:flagellar hook-basal body complex protein [Thioclava sp. FTW29]